MASPNTPGAGGFPPLADMPFWCQRSAANVAIFFEQLARARERQWVHWHDAWAMDMQCPSPIFNSATLLHPLDPAQVHGLLDRLEHFYAARPGPPWLLWSAWPSPELQQWGYTLAFPLSLMIRPPGAALPPPPSDLRVVEATDAALLADAEQVAINGYPLPELQPVQRGSLYDARGIGGQMHVWVGYLGDRPVATAMAVIDEHVNGIYAVATLPEARGRGFGTALTSQAVAAAPAQPSVLEATEGGSAIYVRLGFTAIARYDVWTKPR